MDYKTKSISRKSLRIIAKYIRELFNCSDSIYFDVIDAYERIPDIFPNITTEIVEDTAMPKNVPARCKPDFNGSYHIEVKNSIYEGACNGVGGYRAHIMHEICHAILCMLGFTPCLNREFKNNEIVPPYISMEWQAKALCGEILVPYDKIDGFSAWRIQKLCVVSEECAENAIKNLHTSVQYKRQVVK